MNGIHSIGRYGGACPQYEISSVRVRIVQVYMGMRLGLVRIIASLCRIFPASERKKTEENGNAKTGFSFRLPECWQSLEQSRKLLM